MPGQVKILRCHPAWRKSPTHAYYHTPTSFTTGLAVLHTPLPRFLSPSEAHSIMIPLLRSHRPQLSVRVPSESTYSSSTVYCILYYHFQFVNSFFINNTDKNRVRFSTVFKIMLKTQHEISLKAYFLDLILKK